MGRFEIHEDGMRELANSREIKDALLDVGERIARRAAIDAPKLTGFGASTIHPEAVRANAQWVVRVGWSPEAAYLRYPHFGTKYIEADPFLEHAAEGFL